jgi:class 3 adenylate cyclase/predicted ATPase
MRCTACQSENAPGRKFCASCGAALGIICPACGHANAATDRFCGECGSALATAPAKPPSAEEEGELRPAVILFADLSGYTSHSRSADPEDVQALLNRFFERADRIVIEAGGTVDKHIGDCVMAVFGAPVAHGDDAVRACRAARDILDIGEAGAALKVHGGIAMGQVFAGATGSTHHGTYTVTGSAVNLASRLCDLASPGEMLVAENVVESVSSRFEFSAIKRLQVDGFAEPAAVASLGRATGASISSGNIFVGRERELRQLSTFIEEVAKTRRGQAVEIIGEAGIGKSRLVERVATLARRRNMHIGIAAISSLASGRGADATRMLMRALVGYTDAVSPSQQAVRVIADFSLSEERAVFVYELLDLPIPAHKAGYFDALGQEARRLARADLLRALAAAASERAPVFLAIEDIHWAERDSIMEIGTFAGMIADLPVLLLMTTRPDGDPVTRAWRNVAVPTPFATFDLPPLGNEESIQLARLIASGGEFAAIVQRAGGNPLFLTQLIRHAHDSESADLPSSISNVVVARLDRLDPESRRAAQSAAVLGTRFASAELTHLLNTSSLELNRLIDAQFLRPAGDQFEFTHALVRDAVYATLPKSRRLQLHGKAAQWFAGKDIGLEALHLEGAQDPGAARAYLQAAVQALQHFRNSLAADYNAKGLHIAVNKEDRIALQIQRSEIHYESGNINAAIESWRNALDLGASPIETCQMEIGLAQSLRIVDANEEAMAALDRAMFVAGPLHLNRELSQINFARGNIFFPQGRHDECLAAHRAALEYAKLAESVEAECQAYGGMGDAFYALGKMQSAYDAFDRCVKLAREHGYGRIEVANLPMLSITAHMVGNLEEAQNLADEAIALAKRTGAVRAELVALHSQVLLILELIDTKPARPLLEQASEISAKLGAARFQAEQKVFSATVEWQEGDRPKALQLATEAWHQLRESGRAFFGPAALAVIAIAASDAKQRRETLRQARDILDSGTIGHNHYFFYRFVLEDALDRRELELAEECCKALELYTAEEPVAWSNCWIRIGRALARLNRGEGGGDLVRELGEIQGEAERLGFGRMAARLADATAQLASAG